MEFKVPVLTYHSIDNSGSVISTSPVKFRRQMQLLADASFNVISLSDVVDHIKCDRQFPDKSLAITFDDGFQNVFKEAYPVLKEFGFSATIFLVPGYCGRNNKWNGQPAGIPALELLDWEEIEEMAIGGMEFGAHTMNHPDLSSLPVEEAYEEITHSKTTIQKHLGKDVSLFAYPYGDQNEDITRIIREQFEAACSTELNFVTPESDIYLMPRIDMYYFSRNNLFSYFGTSLASLYINFRKTLRSLRA